MTPPPQAWRLTRRDSATSTATDDVQLHAARGHRTASYDFAASYTEFAASHGPFGPGRTTSDLNEEANFDFSGGTAIGRLSSDV